MDIGKDASMEEVRIMRLKQGSEPHSWPPHPQLHVHLTNPPRRFIA